MVVCEESIVLSQVRANTFSTLLLESSPHRNALRDLMISNI